MKYSCHTCFTKSENPTCVHMELEAAEAKLKAAEKVIEAVKNKLFLDGPTAPIIRALKEYDTENENE